MRSLTFRRSGDKKFSLHSVLSLLEQPENVWDSPVGAFFPRTTLDKAASSIAIVDPRVCSLFAHCEEICL